MQDLTPFVQIGRGINWGVEWTTGLSVGSHVYDWLNPNVYQELGDMSPEQAAEYEAYKEFEKNRPPKGPNCDDMKAQLKYWRTVLQLRSAYANKWYGGTYDPGHQTRVDIAQEQIRKYEKAVEDHCDEQCK